MTRTNVMASSRPQAADAATAKGGSSRARRGLVILPVILALGLAPAVPALAAGTATSTYGEKPPPPTTTPTTPPATTPSTGTSPSSGTSPAKSTKEPATPSTTPSGKVAPATSSSAPATSTQPAKASASTLPFTGLDLRWTVGAGLFLVLAGGSIMVMQRLQRRDDAGL
jgi:Tfp pilus assembly protein FimV